jgi:hypothetical protein
MSIPKSIFKTSSDFFYETGMLHKWTADEMMGIVKSGIDAPSQFLSDSWDDNPNTFRNLGENVGSMAQSTAMTGVNAWFAGHSWRRLHGQKGHMLTRPSGMTDYYRQVSEGTLQRYNPFTGREVKGSAVISEARLAARAKRGLGTLKGGVYSSSALKSPWSGQGAFLGELGMMKGIASMAVPMLVMAGGRAALGVAGSIVDQALGDYRKSRKAFYDERFFNTEENNMSSYQQIGSAMRTMENRYTNVSRIFHSR